MGGSPLWERRHPACTGAAGICLHVLVALLILQWHEQAGCLRSQGLTAHEACLTPVNGYPRMPFMIPIRRRAAPE